MCTVIMVCDFFDVSVITIVAASDEQKIFFSDIIFDHQWTQKPNLSIDLSGRCSYTIVEKMSAAIIIYA